MPNYTKCQKCGGDVFYADISNGTIICVRCREQYSINIANNTQPQYTKPSTHMTDTSSPSDFKIAFGVLKKYTGNSKHVVIPEGVTIISSPDNGSVFYSIESVVFPKSLKAIDSHAFEHAKRKQLDIPFGVREIGSHAFCSCSQLESVSFPSSLTKIGHNAFMNCTSLNSVKLNNGLEIIDDGAFYGCVSLTSINIPDSVVSLSKPSSYARYPFDGCYMLTQISYPSRFSMEIFYGTAWYDEEIRKAKQEKLEQEKLRKAKQNQKFVGITCPKCGRKLNMDRYCPKHGKI